LRQVPNEFDSYILDSLNEDKIENSGGIKEFEGADKAMFIDLWLKMCGPRECLLSIIEHLLADFLLSLHLFSKFSTHSI